MRFRKEHEVKWTMIEQPVHFGKLYAGTIDRLGWVDGKLSLLDIKTGKTISEENKVVYSAAQNMYRTALENENVYPDKLYILHLKSNGRYKLIELPFNFGLQHSCITIHAAFQAARQKKKK